MTVVISVAVLLTLLSSFFSASSTAVFSVGGSRLRTLVEEGFTGAKELSDLRSNTGFLQGILLLLGTLCNLVVVGLVTGLTLLQPDLGTAVLLGVSALLLMFVAGTRLVYIIGATLIAAPLAWFAVVGTPWRLKRFHPVHGDEGDAVDRRIRIPPIPAAHGKKRAQGRVRVRFAFPGDGRRPCTGILVAIDGANGVGGVDAPARAMIEKVGPDTHFAEN